MKPALLKNFYKIFDLYLPQKICEIGTHNGQSAIQFIDYLFPKVRRLHYTGFDLFEDADQYITELEHNGKGPGSYSLALEHLNRRKTKFGKRFSFELIKGNTKETLTVPQIFDFVYIDGGHSYDTVIHDYSMVKDSAVIVFDDYQISEVAMAINDIKKNISDYEFLEIENPSRPKRKQMLMMRWDDGRHDQIAFLRP